MRALYAIRARAGETDPLDIVFVLIGYRHSSDGARRVVYSIIAQERRRLHGQFDNLAGSAPIHSHMRRADWLLRG
jgi:hypothetical protein